MFIICLFSGWQQIGVVEKRLTGNKTTTKEIRTEDQKKIRNNRLCIFLLNLIETLSHS